MTERRTHMHACARKHTHTHTHNTHTGERAKACQVRRPVTGCIPVQSSVPAPWWPYDHMTPRDTAPPTRLRACERAYFVASVVYDSYKPYGL